MSQQQLADLVGASQTAIGNVEAGYTKKPRNLLLMARKLDISADWLDTGEGNMLDGGAPPLEWPFELIKLDEWLALTERQRGVVEAAALAAMNLHFPAKKPIT